MQPDRQIIIKVKLASVGYNEVWNFQRYLQYFTDFMKNNFQIKDTMILDYKTFSFENFRKHKVKRTNFTRRNALSKNVARYESINISCQDKELFDVLLDDIFMKQTKIPKMVYKEVETQVNVLIKTTSSTDSTGLLRSSNCMRLLESDMDLCLSDLLDHSRLLLQMFWLNL